MRGYRKQSKRLCFSLVFVFILLLCFLSLFLHQLSRQRRCNEKLIELSSTLTKTLATTKQNEESSSTIITPVENDVDEDIDPSTPVIEGPVRSASHQAPKICSTATWNETAVIVAGRGMPDSASNEYSVLLDVFVDDQNAMYIADSYNHRIIKWDEDASEGQTVAGGNGKGVKADQFDVITAVFVDREESIYAADQNNHRIQKWPKNSKSGETIIGHHGRGSHSNQIDNCWGLYVDNDLNIYVSEHSNHRVTKWKPGANSGEIVANVTKPIGIHVDESNDDLYVASYDDNSIQQFNKNGKLLRKMGTSFLKHPYDFAFVPGTFSTDTSVIVADTENHRIIRMQMNGNESMQIIAGSGKQAGKKESEFHEPRRVRFDSEGNLIVVDANNHRIQKFFIYNNIC